jgi:hypothetical protein
MTEEKHDQPLVEVYKDKSAKGEWRWRRLRGPDEIRKVTADSSEGYTRFADAMEAAERENEGIEIRVLEDEQEHPESTDEVGE